MKLDRLRIVGFKSFVDPTEVPIAPGLTGVVGPNGCGKSNLVEALRWVMGETSHKSMRASTMDDVIFNGSGGRPARNTAEVILSIDNGARTAPASFNDADRLEVARRITRDEGSAYRVNGREARARDVQILFADAATGARSPAMVRQGQIGEIIAAKPQARRRILEDAAGVAGLHARRHEAELRLKAAEDNLARVGDVLTHLDAQIENLNRQARQAGRYCLLSTDIRKAEALVLHLGIAEARLQRDEAMRQDDRATQAVADAMRLQGEAARAEAVADQTLAPARDEEARRAAALQRLVIAREQIAGDERRLTERIEAIVRRLAELDRDGERGRQLDEDAERSLSALGEEDRHLAGAAATDAAAGTEAEAHRTAADSALQAAEHAMAEAQTAVADRQAQRQASERVLKDASERLQRLGTQVSQTEREIAALEAAGGQAGVADLQGAAEAATRALADAESAATEAERGLPAARDAEARARAPLAEAEKALARLDAEIRALQKVLGTGGTDLWPRVLDTLRVAPGYEVALGAALGDDLDASTEASAPVHWLATDGTADPALPGQAEPLADKVTAPPAMLRRLRQIGVVARAEGASLRLLLKPGQRLVSREGDLWRWDGLTAAAEAPTPAARRLAETNRLAMLEASRAEAAERVQSARAAADQAGTALKAAAAADATARDRLKSARAAADQARAKLAAAERQDAERAARETALRETLIRLIADRDEAAVRRRQAEDALVQAEPPAALEAALAEARAAVALRRAEATAATAAVQALAREARFRAERRDTIQREILAWQERRARAKAQSAEIDTRRAALVAEQQELDGAPAELALRRRALGSEIETAERALKQASDARADAETTAAAAAKAARAALDGLAAAREGRARAEATLEAATLRLAEATRNSSDQLDAVPDDLPGLAGIGPDTVLPGLREAEERLASLRRDRDRLGPVNLKAEDELQSVSDSRDGLIAERTDLEAAIGALRRGINQLNAEGRNRLLASFDTVNGHFKRLFSTLFGGGEAELQLIESDDPLEAGLEIMARPPGKKPQVLTLLSGGEQALTASALIFAVFLTNPSPICVLDEIDAPLDDHNVERLCNLLDSMVADTETRFLIITHHPITMARMDRLFGVTMAERGVSQLVSVDLAAAERLAEAS
jgi:chromosome segregation protein